MMIQVETNPNSQGCEQFVFNELGASRPILALRAEVNGMELICAVVGVGASGVWQRAQAVKVSDSAEGHAYLIYGGTWGIRLRPGMEDEAGAWDLGDPKQWGEPFKLYGSEDDIIYEND